MTNEEMAAKLREEGWLAEPPRTQENCSHEWFGSVGMSHDGGGTRDLTCRKCGKRDFHRWGPCGPRPDFRMVLQNAILS